ncbi:MAG: hypothetical protein V3W22_06910, partial [Thermoplasmata archaeon]
LGLVVNPVNFAEVVPSMGPAAGVTEMMVTTVTAPLFNLVLKLPIIGADLGIAVLLFRWISSSYGQDSGKSALLLWFFNPLVIWVNAAQGQFDVIPAFFALAGSFLLVRRRFFSGGLALGLSILFKLYAAFLLIPLLFIVLVVERRVSNEGEQHRLQVLRSPILFLLGVVVTLTSLGLPLLWTRFLEVAILRRAQFPVVGGFNPLFFLSLDVWEGLPWAQALIEQLPGVASPYMLVLPLIVSILAGLAILRSSKSQKGGKAVEETLAFVTVLALVALYSSLALVNPQHLLWVLPFLVLASARWRSLRSLTIIVSLAGLLFLFSLQGAAVFFYPLAVFTPLLSVDTLNNLVLAYWAIPGILSSRLQKDLLFLASGVGYAALLIAAYRVTRYWKRGPVEVQTLRVPSTAPRNEAVRTADVVKLSALATAFLVVSQLMILYDGTPSSGSLEDAFYDTSEAILRVDIQGHGLFDASYRITVIGFSEKTEDLPIYLYYDPSQPVANVSRPRILGIADHLRSELALMGLSDEVIIAGTTDLLELLRGPPAILILSTTALPREIFSPDPALMKGWIEEGGVLVWTGALIGRYMGTAGGSVVDMVETFGQGPWGPGFIMGFDPVGEKGKATAMVSTPWKEALDIRYPLAAWGASVEEVEARSGVILGGVTVGQDPKTSLSLFRVGDGTVALFGNAPGSVFTYSAEDVIAHDIARLILSGLLTDSADASSYLLATEGLSLGRGEEGTILLPLQLPENLTSLQVLVFSQVDFDALITGVKIEI